jgi:SPOR domain
MADDHSQRPYRSNEAPARGVPARAPAPASGADPLAELARLIGQNDPFSDRDGARRPAAPAPDWAAPTNGAAYPHQGGVPDMRAAAAAPHANDYFAAAHTPVMPPPMPEGQPHGGQNYGRQVYGGPPPPAGADIYQTEVPGYPPAHGGSYEQDPHQQNGRPFSDEEEDDLYDDVPPKRRRIGIMAVAVVFALAVIGTAGAFGYRALFGTTGSGGPPPVITADSGPSKIVPATNSKDAQSNKMITDRVNDHGQGEKLVSREEQPIDIKDKPAGVMFPQGQDAQSAATQATLGSGVVGSGVVGSEPKKIRTIAIHPDGSVTADATPVSASAAATPARVTSTVAPARQQAPAVAQASASAPPPAPVRVVNIPPRAADPEPAPRQAEARAAPPVQQQATAAAAAAAAPEPNNAPLSLSADTAPPAPARAARPARTAAVAAPAQIASAPGAASGGSGGYAVQVSSQRSEAEAQAAFRSLQGKYPGQLGSRQPLIHRVDLGAKGIYFRAMVGPFGNSNEAGELCSSLKAAGGECIVQRN